MLNIETAQEQTVPAKKRTSGNLGRIAKYTLVRGLTLIITVVIGVYLAILIANGGGYVDKMREGQVREQLSLELAGNEAMSHLTLQERRAVEEDMVKIRIEQLGLDRPFMIRSFEYLWNGLTLNLGSAEYLLSDSGSRQVRNILGERLAPTLLLMATGQLFLFFISVFFALFLSRRYGSVMDKIVVALAPTSAAPSWFYGIFLILIFAALLGWLPFGGMVAAPPPENAFLRILSTLKHMILPVGSIVISSIFLTSYYWRTFFLIYSSEDYVEMAKAKGLSGRAIERRYVLRPTLPTIITSFALTLIGLWTGAIVLETVFAWPGIGRLTQSAINMFDTPVIVGTVVIYAYLLAITVFLLDIIYALVDPRVKLGGGGTRS
ncbi:MAG: ABC transporter permease subunit [Firmicutes bacterium]|nr:ABC transporter permease subunit [Bacillota bacterium]MDD4264239.1 ABC transporter permease subunit [Bacillota bacterium]MDD4693734.1 ABC transporter permease subunit [Bacillota bacterium]